MEEEASRPAQDEHGVVVEIEECMGSRLIQHRNSDMYYFAPIDGSTETRPMIRMVPGSIQKGNEGAYTPKFISIGPFHNRDISSELTQMEPLKWRYLQDLIQRSPENTLHKYISAVREKEGEIRKHYLGDLGRFSDDKKLVEMLVLDGCFVLEFLFKRAQGPVGYHWSDFRWNLTLLLENQIPFFVLQLLFENTDNVPQPPEDGSARLTLMDFALHYLFKSQRAGKIMIPREKIVHHLLHLYHLGEVQLLNSIRNQANQRMKHDLYYLKRPLKLALKWFTAGIFFLASIFLMQKIPPVMIRNRDDREDTTLAGARTQRRYPRTVPTARKLRDAGVTFKRKVQRTGHECLLDVSFNEEDGEIEMPFLLIQSHTESLLRSLIALEHCNVVAREEQYFTSFATFMDQIIDTPEDVAILRDHMVMKSRLSSDENVATLFNGTGSGTNLNYDKHYLKDLFLQVNDYTQSNRSQWRASLVQHYARSPWKVIFSFIIASLLLALTTLQATYTVKRGYKK